MNVLLVMPSQSGIYGKFTPPDCPPLGLAYLAAVLEKAGHRVKIIDVDADKVTNEKFVSILRQGDYGLVGVTTTTPTFKKAIELTRVVKENTRAFTILGGVHVTVTPEESLRFDSVDFIVKGEGELTILELAKYLEQGGDITLIDGIYYRDNGGIKKNKDRALIENLDELPFPARHHFNKRNYSYPDALLTPIMPIITSRGCPAACTFCNSNSIFTRKFRVRSAQNILAEIECLIREFSVKEIHIWDDNFTAQKNRVFQIRDEIKRRDIRVKFAFTNGLRVDYVDEEILRALKDMGTYSIAFGVESGNQRVLDRIKKNIKLEEVERAFRLAKKIGLETWAFFMIGLPGDTEDSIRDTINFAIKLNPDVVKFQILKPFPGTEVYKEFLKEGLLLDNDYDHFGIHTPPVHRLETLNPEDILKWYKRAYRSFYGRPSIIIKQLLRLKTFNRLKVNASAALGVIKNMI